MQVQIHHQFWVHLSSQEEMLHNTEETFHWKSLRIIRIDIMMHSVLEDDTVPFLFNHMTVSD